MDNQPTENTGLTSDRIQILLKEYEICHSDGNALGSRFWSFANIFIPTNLALLGLLVSFILNNTVTPKVLFVIAIVALPAIGILVCVLFWLKRVNQQHEFNYERAREIEIDLGMWKNWRLHAIGHFNDKRFNMESIPEDQVENIIGKLLEYHELKWWKEKKRRRWFLRSHIGSNSVYAIFYILMGLWAILFIYGAVSI